MLFYFFLLPISKSTCAVLITQYSTSTVTTGPVHWSLWNEWMRLHVFDTVLLLVWMQPQSLCISFMGQLSSYRFQWLRIEVPVLLYVPHISHVSHGFTILKLIHPCNPLPSDCRKWFHSHQTKYIVFLFAIDLLFIWLFSKHSFVTLSLGVFSLQVSLLHHQAPCLLTSSADRASHRKMAQRTKRVLGFSCITSISSYYRGRTHLLLTSWVMRSQMDSSNEAYVSLHLVTQCFSTCIFLSVVCLDLTFPLYMQVNIYIFPSTCKDQMLFVFY